MSKNKFITFSFDDGFISDFKMAELLEKYGFECTFFIATSHDQGALGTGDIKTLSQISDIGGHTCNHKILSSLERDEQKNEIIDNKKYLEDLIGKEIHLFCYPKGKYSNQTIEVVKASGFWGARTTKCFHYRIQSPFEIPTSLQIYPHTYFTHFRHSLVGKDIKSLKLLIPSFAERLGLIETIQYLANKVYENGGVLHLWGHTWELDKLNIWEYFENILSILKDYEFQPINNSDLVLNNKNI